MILYSSHNTQIHISNTYKRDLGFIREDILELWWPQVIIRKLLYSQPIHLIESLRLIHSIGNTYSLI